MNDAKTTDAKPSVRKPKFEGTPVTYKMPNQSYVNRAIQILSERYKRHGKRLSTRVVADRIFNALAGKVSVVRTYRWSPKEFGKRGVPRACIVAFKDDHTVRVGWCAMHPKENVTPDKKLMGVVAYLSAGCDIPAPSVVLKTIHADNDKFITRCRKYFGVRRVSIPREFKPVVAEVQNPEVNPTTVAQPGEVVSDQDIRDAVNDLSHPHVV